MLTCLYLLVALEKNVQAVLEKGQVPGDVSEALLDHIGRVEVNISVISLVLMVISIFMGVRLSHRIYGPIVQFRRHVASLAGGDYSSRVNLRDHDHFFELSEDLNALAEKLQKR